MRTTRPRLLIVVILATVVVGGTVAAVITTDRSVAPGLHNGSTLPDVTGSDVDSLEPVMGHLSNVRVFAHSALPAHANTHVGDVFYSDMTYYTDRHPGRRWRAEQTGGPSRPTDAAGGLARAGCGKLPGAVGRMGRAGQGGLPAR
jgi:hypothetical protein